MRHWLRSVGDDAPADPARRRGYEVSVMKAAVEAAGYPAGAPRAPLVAVNAQERREIEELVMSLKVPTFESRGALV